MYDDLIVVTYPRTMDAMMAWVRLHLLNESLPLGTNTALLLSVSERGKASAMQASELTDVPCSSEMRFLGSLTRQIINRSYKQEKHPLIGAGIEETFLNGLTQSLGPGRSAIVFYAPASGFVDISQLLTVLSEEQGTVHHTTLTPATAEMILELETPN